MMPFCSSVAQICAPVVENGAAYGKPEGRGNQRNEATQKDSPLVAVVVFRHAGLLLLSSFVAKAQSRVYLGGDEVNQASWRGWAEVPPLKSAGDF